MGFNTNRSVGVLRMRRENDRNRLLIIYCALGLAIAGAQVLLNGNLSSPETALETQASEVPTALRTLEILSTQLQPQ